LLLKHLQSFCTLCLRASAGCCTLPSRAGRLRPLLQYALLIGGLLAASAPLLTAGFSRAEMVGSEPQTQARETDSPLTVVNLQPFRTVHSIKVDRPDGKTAELTLINLNPNVNQWYILRLNPNGDGELEEYHLENPYPKHQHLVLDEKSPDSLLFTLAGKAYPCRPWSFSGESELRLLRRSVTGRSIFVIPPKVTGLPLNQ
jgi:hypothetical protein